MPRSILLLVVLLHTALLAAQMDHLGGYWRNDQGIGANWAHWKDQVWFTSINPNWKEYFEGKVVGPNRVEGRLVHINLLTWERQEMPLVIANSVSAKKLEQKNNSLKELASRPLYRQMRFYVGLILGLAALLGFRFWWREKQRVREADLRRHIARELHDDIGSIISSISILTEAARRRDVNQSADPQLDAIGKKAREALDNIGDIMWSMKTPRVTAKSLFLRMKEFAVETLEAQGTEVIFSVERSTQPLPLDSEQSKDSYLFFKEAVNNAAKYAQARQVWITVKTKKKAIRLEISDNGKGFDLETVKKGNGLHNMQARAERLNGKLSMVSQPGKGTQIRLHFKP